MKVLYIALVAFSLAFAFTDIVLRFPRQNHTRQDDWPEFAHLTPKLKRWHKENSTIEHDPINMEERKVTVLDANSRNDLWLSTSGFELVDLHPRILSYLREIKKNGLVGARVGPSTAGSNFLLFFSGGSDEVLEDKLARALQGSDSFSLGNGKYHYAFRCAGFVIRKGGPEGSKLPGSGFDMVAQRVHIDQDLDGEPLLSMGLNWIFKLPFMYMVNIWSPLHDIRMRPMAFADRRTIHVESDVVRYRANSTQNAGGRLGSFRSDRLMSLYSERHQWYWYPNVRFGQAIAFDTSNVPHSSFSIPGEELLSTIRQDILDLKDNPVRKSSLCTQETFQITPSEEISLDMEALISSALGFKKRICESRGSPNDFDEILDYLTRASLEIRCVTFVAPSNIAHFIRLLIFGSGSLFFLFVIRSITRLLCHQRK